MTIKELLQQGALVLVNRENAVLEVEILLAYAFVVDREYLIAHVDEEAEDEFTVALYWEFLNQLKAGMPLAYILGEKEFYGENFFVDQRVLVPRPETEMLVEEVLKFLTKNVDSDELFNILDLGTGSGNIAISLAKNCDNGEKILVEEIDAVDLSEDALEVCRVNVENHGVLDIVHVFQSDLLTGIDREINYDVIVANLPYIGKEKNRVVDENVSKYEPDMALFGGQDGLELYEKLFEQISERGMDFKLLVGEFCYGQGDDLRELLNKYFDQKWRIEKDLAGIERMFVVEV
jgi:release factor glutamine methyltransferase